MMNPDVEIEVSRDDDEIEGRARHEPVRFVAVAELLGGDSDGGNGGNDGRWRSRLARQASRAMRRPQ